MLKQKQIVKLPNLRDDSLLPAPASGVGMNANVRMPLRLEFNLSAFSVSVLAANDYGSAKLCDLPSSNLQVLGAIVDLISSQSGFTSNNGSAIDLAIGTAATASTDFSGTNEKNLVAKIDGTGTTVGSILGSSVEGAVGLVGLAQGAKSVYVNVADPVTAGTGVLLLTGKIILIVEDLGSHA